MRAAGFHTSYADFGRLIGGAGRRTALIVAALALLLLPAMLGTYALSFATLILITSIGTIGFNVLVGWTGLVSLGYAGFFALGAYANGALTTHFGWPFFLAIPGAAAVAALASLVVGIPSLRLRGLYLAITTLAFSVITNQVILLAKPLTGGSAGLAVARPRLAWLHLGGDAVVFELCMLVFGFTIWLACNIRRSYLGRALFAIRDHEIAARVLGVDLVKYKLLSFAISSALTGAAGALFSLQMQYLNVESFDLQLSVEAISIVIVGGLGSIAGAVLGTIFMVLLPEVVRSLFSLAGDTLANLFTSQVEEVKGVIDGVVIVLFLRWAPTGMIGHYDRLARAVASWPLPR
jgi:branched-chain amino acid transport system permease protein